MIIKRAYKFKLKTNYEIEHKFRVFSGCSRFVWNKVLALNLDRLNQKQDILWYGETSFWLTLWKQSQEYGFLNDCHSQVLQQKLKDLERAFKDAFDRKQPMKRIPTFKKKGESDGFKYPQGFKMDNRRIFLPKIGWVGFFKSCDIKGTPKNVTVSRLGRDWFISVQVEQELPVPQRKSGDPVGIDMGVAKFVTLSTGEKKVGENSFRTHQKKLAREQQKLSRKVKFSSNWKKQKNKIAVLHTEIAGIRKDYINKASTEICKNHAIICMEDLNIKNMSTSAKGNLDSPGRKVAQKSGLNKSILDQGWGEFRRQMEYKSAWSGGVLVFVNPAYTSQTCSCCGHVDKNSRNKEYFHCTHCGMEMDADVNAAKNILTAGLAGMACESNRISGRKQEPVGIREDILPMAV